MAEGRSYGDRLRDARERQGIDLVSMARALHIRPDIVRAIESADFRKMPAHGYSKNMVRAYARKVGLDEEAISSQYLAEREQGRAGALKGVGGPVAAIVLLLPAAAPSPLTMRVGIAGLGRSAGIPRPSMPLGAFLGSGLKPSRMLRAAPVARRRLFLAAFPPSAAPPIAMPAWDTPSSRLTWPQDWAVRATLHGGRPSAWRA